jgi:outer membrane phospholipase A
MRRPRREAVKPIRSFSRLAAQTIALHVLLLSAPASAAENDDSPPARPNGALDQFESARTLGQRLTVYEPIYLIGGNESPEAKFQLSFKYRLATFRSAPDGTPSHSLQFAYTQRSLWDVGSRSSPFFDTSYIPELLYQWNAAKREPGARGFAWLGLQSGVRHESNGQADDSSRSFNEAFVRLLFALGPMDGWHLVAVPEIHDFIGGLSENPALDRYRGNVELRAGVVHGDRESLLLTVIPGQDFYRGSRQLDLTIPLRIRSIRFGTYLLLQYFDGYGESLRAFDEYTSVLRVGVALVR